MPPQKRSDVKLGRETIEALLLHSVEVSLLDVQDRVLSTAVQRAELFDCRELQLVFSVPQLSGLTGRLDMLVLRCGDRLPYALASCPVSDGRVTVRLTCSQTNALIKQIVDAQWLTPGSVFTHGEATRRIISVDKKAGTVTYAHQTTVPLFEAANLFADWQRKTEDNHGKDS